MKRYKIRILKSWGDQPICEAEFMTADLGAFMAAINMAAWPTSLQCRVDDVTDLSTKGERVAAELEEAVRMMGELPEPDHTLGAK